MNVLIIINSFRLGGAEKLCYDLAKELYKKNNLHIYLYSIGKVSNDLEFTIFNNMKSLGIQVGSFNKPFKRERIKTSIKIKKFCVQNKIDVVHTNGQSPDFLMRLSKLLGNKAKVVVTIHNTAGYSKFIEGFFSKFTNVYTAVSKDTLRYATNIVGIKKQIHLINNAINLDTYANIVNNHTNFQILSVGRIQPQKNYLKAVDFISPFLKRHPDVKWIICGDYEDNYNYYHQVRNKIEKLGVLNSVEFKGVLTKPDDIYKYGDVFLLASDYEGFGIAFIEAIMSEHYIFSQNVGVIQDILNNGGIVHNINDKSSINFLEDIYNRKIFKDEILLNKKIVIENYSITNMVDKYFNIYERTLNYGK